MSYHWTKTKIFSSIALYYGDTYIIAISYIVTLCLCLCLCWNWILMKHNKWYSCYQLENDMNYPLWEDKTSFVGNYFIVYSYTILEVNFVHWKNNSHTLDQAFWWEFYSYVKCRSIRISVSNNANGNKRVIFFLV